MKKKTKAFSLAALAGAGTVATVMTAYKIHKNKQKRAEAIEDNKPKEEFLVEEDGQLKMNLFNE